MKLHDTTATHTSFWHPHDVLVVLPTQQQQTLYLQSRPPHLDCPTSKHTHPSAQYCYPRHLSKEGVWVFSRIPHRLRCYHRYGTGLETHSINTFLMASPCYGGRGHVICALFGIMAGVATSEATTASSELLRTAVQMVLKDVGFDIPSEPARRARALGEKYLEWCQEDKNERDFQLFSEDLVKDVEACFTSLPTAKARRERMWERYFKYRSSSEFTHKWKDHLSAVEESPSPLFYQFITDVIMEHLIRKHFPVTSEHVECSATLDYEEHNAIRYTAGYVLRAIQKKINRSSHPLKGVYYIYGVI